MDDFRNIVNANTEIRRLESQLTAAAERERVLVAEVINEELVRLHDTMKLLTEHPDRIIGDLMHSDIHDDIIKLHNTLISIAKKEGRTNE